MKPGFEEGFIPAPFSLPKAEKRRYSLSDCMN